MALVEILTVESTFEINRNGVLMLILHPNFPPPARGWQNRKEPVTILIPDGSQIPATAELAMTHVNISDPMAPMSERWRITIWLTDRTSNEVPVGSKVLISSETRDALLSHD